MFLKTRGGVTLSREQTASIQHLIAAAVPQLQPGQISVVDDKGNLLARPKDGAMGGNGGDRDDMRLSFEQAQARKIEDLLSQTLGFGKVRAQVSAELDYDRITTNSEIYDPESQVVRSTQSTSENSANAEGGSQGVSVANNLPNTTPAGAGGSNSNTTNRSEETINYEINKTIRSQVRESGQVKRLSVAVVVDDKSTTDAEGKTTYEARTTEEMERIRALVRSAVNFDANRGDTLEVANMRFAQGDAVAAGTSTDLLMGIPKADLLRMVETLILAIIGLLVVFLVVRPILKRLFESAGNVGAEQQQLLGGSVYGSGLGSGAVQLPPPGGALSREIQSADTEISEVERTIDISRVEGRVKASSLRKVGEIVEKHPEEAVGILRNWIYSESR